jgi:hypothetical protein
MSEQVIIPIDLEFDAAKIIEVYDTIESTIKETIDKQISITSMSGNNVLEGIGKISSLTGSEKEHQTLNNVFKNTYIEHVHNTLLNNFEVFRGRVMLLEGKKCYTYHRDPTWRLHIPVITNESSIFLIEDVVYRLSNPGQVYLVNTKLFHSAINMKLEDRVHLVYGLNYE